MQNWTDTIGLDADDGGSELDDLLAGFDDMIDGDAGAGGDIDADLAALLDDL